jgi:hypothetical protein
MMRPKPTPQPNRTERYWSGLYGALMTRYANCDLEWSVPMQSVKLYAKRVGLDRVLDMLVRYGTAVVAERCRHEMAVRQQFLAHMLTTYPSSDPEEEEGAIKEMAEDLAIIDSEAGALRLLRYLDRLRHRELLMRLDKTKVH